jgi:hypothetical protein
LSLLPAQQWVSGNQNVQIAGVGAGATIQVSIGAALPVWMPLRQAEVPIGAQVQSPARLMRARAGVVPFVDRAGLVSGLDEWIGRPDPFAAYLVGGRGGAGKTRLGVHLCIQAAARGWVCGLLTSKVDPAEGAALAHLPSPRLVVVDYAESRTEQLEVLLPLLAAQATEVWPVRVLLLVRALQRTGQDWRTPLRIRRSDELERILDETEVQVLDDTPLDVSSREALFTSAADAFAARLPGDHAAPSRASVDLSGAAFANPLLLTIAAYLAVHDPDRAVPDSRAALLGELAGHEDAYWQASAHTARVQINAENLRAKVVALATLAGADSEQEAAQLLALLPELADAKAERRYELAGWVSRQYPGPRWWNQLEPDLLGEYLVAQHLTSQPEVLAGVLRGRNAAALAQPLDLFARATVDYPMLAMALRPVLEESLVDLCQTAIDQAASQTDMELPHGGKTAAAALTRLIGVINIDAQLLSAAASLFPPGPNQILSPLKLILTSQLVEHRRQQAVVNPAAYEPDLAMSLTSLSVRLADVGRQEEGLAAIEQAVEIRRKLAQANPAAYEPGLAMSLNNLSALLADVGRREEGLAPIQLAVDMRRRLAQMNPALYELGLARSLTNLSNRLADVGRREEGLAAIQQAVEIRRRFAQANPAAYEPGLARSLNNLSNRLADVGRREQGLAAIQEAVEMYRRLAQANPAAYEPDLAMSLNNLSNRLADVGRREEGLAAIQEAVEMYRRLAQANPAAYEPDLAKSLNDLSNALKQLGRLDEAQASKNEANRLLSTLHR